jgi:hypothetical protein
MKTAFFKFIVLSFLSISMVFATENSCELFEEIKQDLVGAYNPAAPVEVNSCWNVFINGSFLWYKPIEDGLNLAYYTSQNSNSSTVKTDFEYIPGFKLGLGANTSYDHWVIFFEYTRLASSFHSSKTASSNQSLYSLWIPSTIDGAQVLTSKTNGDWHFNLSLFDLTLGRPYYAGAKMLFNTFIGLRSGWIDQQFFSDNFLFSPTGRADKNVKSDSWLFGARLGVDASYLFNSNFRIFGNGAASLFYQNFKMNYTYHLMRQNSFTVNQTGNDKTSYLTPNLEASLGLGWGSYFYKQKWHFDLLASYDFQIFWNQNMLRSFKDLSVNNTNGACGDLMFQGLNIALRFDF